MRWSQCELGKLYWLYTRVRPFWFELGTHGKPLRRSCSAAHTHTHTFRHAYSHIHTCQMGLVLYLLRQTTFAQRSSSSSSAASLSSPWVTQNTDYPSTIRPYLMVGSWCWEVGGTIVSFIAAGGLMVYPHMTSAVGPSGTFEVQVTERKAQHRAGSGGWQLSSSSWERSKRDFVRD